MSSLPYTLQASVYFTRLPIKSGVLRLTTLSHTPQTSVDPTWLLIKSGVYSPSVSSLFSPPLFFHILTYTHSKSLIMSGPGVGFEYPPVKVTWLQRDVLLFANTIGATADELHFLYVRRDPA